MKTGLRTVALLAILGILAGSLTVGAQGRDAANSPILRFAGDEAQVSLRSAGGRNVVDVHIGDEGPFSFIIDTGASVSVIDTELATRLGLEKVGSVATGAPGAQRVDAAIVKAPLLRVGKVEIVDARPILLGLSTLSRGLFVGVLGMDAFRSVLLTIDPAAGRATVSRGRLTSGRENVLAMDRTMPGIGFKIDVAGQSIPVHLDTGSPGAFAFPDEFAEKIPTLPGPERKVTAGVVGGSREIRIRQMDGTIRFAGLTFDKPSVGFISPSPPVGNIGSQILDRLVISVDQANGLIAFARTEAPAPEQEPRRLGLRLGGPGSSSLSSVTGVDSESLAERSGLREGDTIVTLNGRPISEFDAATLGDLFRGTETLEFVVIRTGTRHVFKIP